MELEWQRIKYRKSLIGRHPALRKKFRVFRLYELHRRFIQSYSKIAKPLHELIGDRVLFHWNEQCEAAFRELRGRFGEHPILTTEDPDLPKMIESDASDLAIGAVLSQLEETKKWNLLDCIYRQFTPAELNYDVHDRDGCYSLLFP